MQKKLTIFMAVVVMVILASIGTALSAQVYEDPYGWSGHRWLQWMGVSEAPEPGDPGTQCQYYCDDWVEWELHIIWEPNLNHYSVFKRNDIMFLYVGPAYVRDGKFTIELNSEEWFTFPREYPAETLTQLSAGYGKVINPNSGAVGVDVKSLLFLAN